MFCGGIRCLCCGSGGSGICGVAVVVVVVNILSRYVNVAIGRKIYYYSYFDSKYCLGPNMLMWVMAC